MWLFDDPGTGQHALHGVGHRRNSPSLPRSCRPLPFDTAGKPRTPRRCCLRRSSIPVDPQPPPSFYWFPLYIEPRCRVCVPCLWASAGQHLDRERSARCVVITPRIETAAAARGRAPAGHLAVGERYARHTVLGADIAASVPQATESMMSPSREKPRPMRTLVSRPC